MRSLLPNRLDAIDLDEIASLYAYPPDGAVRANMVTSLDGAVSADGRSAPISGPSDTYMFGVLRALSDAVVVGAGTARAEGYGPGRERAEFEHLRAAAGQAPAPTIAVVTRSADLDPTTALFTEAKARTIVITCESASAERRAALSHVADVVVCGDDAVDLQTARKQLTSRGLTRVLAEGGPRLLGDLALAGLVDELALSLSPVIAGGSAGRIVATSSLLLEHMTLRSLLEADDFLFALYSRREPEQAS